MVFDKWGAGSSEYQADVNLTGALQSMVICYGQVSGSAYLILSWTGPGSSAKVVIPPSAFWHDPIDAAGNASGPPIEAMPADAVILQGHHYRVFEEKMPWQAAQRRCRWMGGHLPYPKMEAIVRPLNELCRGQADDVWIGATDEGHEGDWRWADGSKVLTDGWHSGQPDGGINENYMSIQKDDGWNDNHMFHFFACEWDR